jgi:flagellar hook-associated protein 1 FlgK
MPPPPGFNRQLIVPSTNTPQFTGAGYLGQGTNIETVQRVYNQFLASQVLTAQTAAAAELDAYYDQIRQVDDLLADSNAGLSPALRPSSRRAWRVAANPSSLPARQSMLSAAQALVARFHSLDTRLNEIRDGVDTQIASTVTEINSYATQIAELNQRIINAQAASPASPNDLLDQRDQLIADLNTKIRATAVTESDGSSASSSATARPLVIGAQTFPMTTMPPARTAAA